MLHAGEIILRPEQEIKSLVILVQGHLEVFTMTDGHYHVLERLEEGSVLNHHSFFLSDQS